MGTILSNPLTLVLAGVVGVLVGLLVSLIFRNESKANPEENPLPKKFSEKGYAEAVGLFFSPAEKKALIQLDGDFYAEFSSLTPEQKIRTMRVLKAWQIWCGTDETEPFTENVVKPPVLPDHNKVEAAAERPVAPAVVLPPLSPLPAEKSKPAPVIAKPETIVEQINEVLGKMLENSADEKRGIRLVDNGHEGVVVWVGVEKFGSIDEVPYADVKQLIRAAVTRWEEQAVAKASPTETTAK